LFDVVSQSELASVEGGMIRRCEEELMPHTVEYNNAMGYIGKMYTWTITVTESISPC
jgi:hypothetical protein